MKIRVLINEAPINIDEIVEGNTEEDLWQQFRRGGAARAPFLLKMALKTMSDAELRRQIVQGYNQKFKASEPIPATAKEFIEFGERAGFVTRL